MTFAQKVGLAATAALAIGYFGVMAAINYGGCHLYGYQTDRTVKYAIGVGCMVKKESGWTPKAELRTEQ